jgi:hypothetical protein
VREELRMQRLPYRCACTFRRSMVVPTPCHAAPGSIVMLLG